MQYYTFCFVIDGDHSPYILYFSAIYDHKFPTITFPYRFRAPLTPMVIAITVHCPLESIIGCNNVNEPVILLTSSWDVFEIVFKV